MRSMLSLVVLGILSACSHPKLAIGPPPVLAVFERPAPKPPAAQEVPLGGDEPVEVELAEARPAPDFRDKFLGLAALDSPAAALPRKVESFLSFDLLRRGISRFVDLSQGKAIQVSLDRGKTIATPASKEDTRWQSTLDKMFFLGRVSRADYVAYGTFLEARTVVEERQVKFKLDEDQLKDYRQRHAAWVAEGKQASERLASAVRSYTEQFEQAQRAYLDDGGKFEDSPPNDARKALDAYETFQAYAAKLRAWITQAIEAAPVPDKLVEAASARANTLPVNVAVVEVLVKLMDVDQGEVIWGAKLRKRAVAGDRPCLEPALRPVLQKFLDLVLANSGAPKQTSPYKAPEWECTTGASAALVEAAHPAQTPRAEPVKAAVVAAEPPPIDISGTWRDPSGTPSIQITTTDQGIVIKYQSGLRFTGTRTGPGTVRFKFDDDGCCEGKVSADTIRWSNGTAWTR